MSAVEALKAARDVGVSVHVDGDGLVLEAPAPPSAAVLDLLSRHKAGVIALLRAGGGWGAEDWRAFYDGRAGIAEFDGGLPRPEAEARAFACCVAEWLNQNPVARRLMCGCPLRCKDFERSQHVIGCGHVSGLAVRRFTRPRAGMEIRGSSPDHKRLVARSV